MAEVWRPVPACRWFGIRAGVFEASDEGRVKADGLLREPQPDKDDYLRFKLRGRWFYVHVLVCLAFHGPPQVRHLNGHRQVNKPAELAWGGWKENEKDKWRYGKEGKTEVSPPFPAVTPVSSDVQER